MDKETNALTPSQYFEMLKGSKETLSNEEIKQSFEVFIKLGKKYERLGQSESLKKLNFLADVLCKEEKLVNMGITTYVYKDKIRDYIKDVADKTVKIIELERYTREIPDELVEVVEKTRDIFDNFYVVFTDYTGEEERKVEKERRDKDPILFGAFADAHNVADRFYFLGDWVDEYCDLTLDKMIAQYSEKKGESPAYTIDTVPQTTEELVDIIKSYKIDDTREKDNKYTLKSSTNIIDASDAALELPTYTKTTNTEKKGFFDKVRTIFAKG